MWGGFQSAEGGRIEIRPTFDVLMTWFHEWFGEEYIELYSHRDDDEAKQQVAFFREHCGNVHGPLLDLACGKGRHIAELRAAGYRAVGCDLSFILLLAGRAEYGPLPVARVEKSSPRLILVGTKNR